MRLLASVATTTFLLLLLLSPYLTNAIDIKWTPAEGDGPEPASARYREQMAKLRELEAQQAERERGGGGGGGEGHPSPHQHQHQHQQRQAAASPRGPPQQELGLIPRLLQWTFAHPGVVATSLAGYALRRTAKRNGLLVSKSPYLTVLEPPLGYLASLLNDHLPEEASSFPVAIEGKSPASFQQMHKSNKKKKKKEEDNDEGRELVALKSIKVGKGEVTYRKAASLVRTLRLLDTQIEDHSHTSKDTRMNRFYSSEKGQEGVFVSRSINGFLWTLMPVAIIKREGSVSQKNKTKKNKKKQDSPEKGKGSKSIEVFEEVLLRSLQGCAWEGELRLSASWRDPTQGGDDTVHMEVAWHTTTANPSPAFCPDKSAFVARILGKASSLIEQELAIYRVREKQQKQFAQDALKAELERKRKARDLLLNPPPDKKQWKKMNRQGSTGGDGPTRWQPSSDLQAKRNPRRGG